MASRPRTPNQLCLHYDARRITADQVQRLAQEAGTVALQQFRHIRFPIEGMDCSDCAVVIQHGLERTEGVLAAQVDFASAQAWAEYDRRRISRRGLEQRVSQLGYRVPPPAACVAGCSNTANCSSA